MFPPVFEGVVAILLRRFRADRCHRQAANALGAAFFLEFTLEVNVDLLEGFFAPDLHNALIDRVWLIVNCAIHALSLSLSLSLSPVPSLTPRNMKDSSH